MASTFRWPWFISGVRKPALAEGIINSTGKEPGTSEPKPGLPRAWGWPGGNHTAPLPPPRPRARHFQAVTSEWSEQRPPWEGKQVTDRGRGGTVHPLLCLGDHDRFKNKIIPMRGLLLELSLGARPGLAMEYSIWSKPWDSPGGRDNSRPILPRGQGRVGLGQSQWHL